MSRDITPDVQMVRLFLTEPHDCSYLEDKQATTAFVDPAVEIDSHLYSQLSDMGFRRSGKYVYIPRCEHCNACLPARLVVDNFQPNRQQRKCNKRNSDLTVWVTTEIDEAEHYPLYERYITERHSDGDMYPPSRSQFKDFISNLWRNSKIIEVRLGDELLAGGVVDILENGLSAVYIYFSCDHPKRSLGTYTILAHVMLAKQMKLPYVYLGYWIKNSPKMAYKSNFQPLEILRDGEWIEAD
jgi:arginyl-tRNA--protein-N-Asp/Glu arginylyltransferase